MPTILFVGKNDLSSFSSFYTIFPSGHWTYNVRTLYVQCTYNVLPVPAGSCKCAFVGDLLKTLRDLFRSKIASLHSSENHGFCGFLGLGFDFGIVALAKLVDKCFR